MDPNADITGFWLAWRKTCSIRRCLDQEILKRECSDIPEVAVDFEKVVKDAHEVIKTTNRYFEEMIKTPRTVKPLKRFAASMENSEEGDEEMSEESSSEAEKGEVVDNESSDAARHEDTRSVYGHLKSGPSLGMLEENEDDVIDSMHGKIRAPGERLARGKMVSEYCDLVKSWYQHDEGVTNAFELVEIDLYREAAVKMPENERGGSVEPKINGKKLKDYLFEDICAATGNICKSLWGYLLKKDWTANGISRLRMVANASFRNPIVDRADNQNGGKTDDYEQVLPDALQGDENIHVCEAAETLRKYWLQRWLHTYDVTDKVSLCCAFFKFILSDPFVVGLVPVKGSALGLRKQKRVGEVFSMLKDRGFDFNTVRTLFDGEGQRVLYEIAVEGATCDSACIQLARHFGKIA